MTKYVQHGLKVQSKPDEVARQNFMLNMRSYVMLDMATGMKKIYDHNIEPNFKKLNKRKPKNGNEIHKLPVTFSYRWWKNLNDEADLPVSVQDAIAGILQNSIERNLLANIPKVISRLGQ